MFLWFIGTAVITVWYVFRDPRFDYRLLIVGSLLPELDALAGGMRWMHSLVFSVALLVVVMVATHRAQAAPQAAARAADRHVPPPRVRRRVGDHRGVLVAVHGRLDR